MTTLVSFELAKLLKEKGFDVKDRIKYEMYGSQVIPQLESYNDTKWNIYKDYHLAPTIAEVCMWLYENYRIWIEVYYDNSKKEFYTVLNGEEYKFNSPTKAYEAAILYVLQNLI